MSRLSQFVESWMHIQVSGFKHGSSILELGAGTLNHLPYERDGEYDIVEPFEALLEGNPLRAKVRQIYRDIADVPASQKYDRIISVAALEHFENLPHALATCGLLLNTGGRLQSGIPSEGGILWGLAWRITTGLAYRLRTGMSYGNLMRHEHLSTAPEIISLIRYFFTDVRIRRFPFGSHHLSLYAYIQASTPRLDRCQDYLDQT